MTAPRGLLSAAVGPSLFSQKTCGPHYSSTCSFCAQFIKILCCFYGWKRQGSEESLICQIMPSDSTWRVTVEKRSQVACPTEAFVSRVQKGLASSVVGTETAQMKGQKPRRHVTKEDLTVASEHTRCPTADGRVITYFSSNNPRSSVFLQKAFLR